MSIHNDLQTYRKSLRWFLDMSHHDHVNRSHDDSLYSPLLRHHHAGHGPGTVIGDGLSREFVPTPATIDRISEALLMSSQGAAADRLPERARALEVALADWQDECHTAVEQWRWDNDATGDVPQYLYGVIGDALCHRLDDVRTLALDLVRLLDVIATAVQPPDPAATGAGEDSTTAALDALASPQQRKLVEFLLGQKRWRKAAVLKCVPGAFQKGDTTSDRAVAAAIERVNSVWDTARIGWRIESRDTVTDPEYKLSTDS